MKRDQDFIRELLFEFEEAEDFYIDGSEVMGISRDEVRRVYHIKLLKDAGFLADLDEGMFRLTNSGHDYIEAIRDEGVWSKTKAAVAETGGSATLEIVKW